MRFNMKTETEIRERITMLDAKIGELAAADREAGEPYRSCDYRLKLAQQIAELEWVLGEFD